METARFNRLQERGGAALRKYERLMASNHWPSIAEFQAAYQADPQAAEAAAEAEEAAGQQKGAPR